MIDSAIYSLILENPDIADTFGHHIYPAIVPEKVKGPAVRYFVDDRPADLDGSGVEGKKKADIQIDVFLPKYTQMRVVAQSLVSQVHGFKGTREAIDFNLIEVLDTSQFFDEKTREHRTTITLTCTYRET